MFCLYVNVGTHLRVTQPVYFDAIINAIELWPFQKSALAVRKLESEKNALQREMEPILAKKPLGPTASSLPLKISAANNKIDDINSFIDLYKKK